MNNPKFITETDVILPKSTHHAFKDLEGHRFGRLVVVGYLGKAMRGQWWCKCDCGMQVRVMTGNLLRGHTRSCGCYGKERAAADKTTHGATRDRNPMPEYRSYHHAQDRCTNPNDKGFHNYGGRGIEFRFTSFEEFFTEVGKRPSSRHSVERVNNNGHYEKGNVIWATPREQANNKRSNRHIIVNGQTQTVSEWERQNNFPRGTIHARIQRHTYCDTCAVTLPVGQRCLHATKIIRDVVEAT